MIPYECNTIGYCIVYSIRGGARGGKGATASPPPLAAAPIPGRDMHGALNLEYLHYFNGCN